MYQPKAKGDLSTEERICQSRTIRGNIIRHQVTIPEASSEERHDHFNRDKTGETKSVGRHAKQAYSATSISDANCDTRTFM